jgi:hypothetical protein
MLTTLVARRRLLVLALVGALIAALGSLVANPATAASPAPVEVRLDAISSAVQAPGGTPSTSTPSVLAVVDQNLTVSVSFFDSLHRPAYFGKDTSLVVTSDHGPVTNVNTVVKKGQYTSQLTVSIPSLVNQVRLTVTVPNGKLAFSDAATDDQRFDVLSQLRFENSTANFQQGIGGANNCADATPQAPVCGVVILPQGASSPQVLLSLGPCDDTGYSGCGDVRGSVVQTLAELNSYTPSSPATMLIKCDKTLCGGGSIQSKHLSYTLAGNAALTTAEACPAKGTVGTQPACVDYVQSKRDGSGDTFLYLLFTRDARVSVG